MHVLIVYGSKDGQTAKIAERIARHIGERGLQVSCYSVDDLPADFSIEAFDGVIVGGSIHIGKYPAAMRHFVTRHRDRLNGVPSALFTVCMAIQSQNAAERDEARKFGERFIGETGWYPALVDTFAGAVKYTRYNFITRWMMKRISKKEGGSTDTRRDHEYTDWEAVAEFADRFAGAMKEAQATGHTRR